MSNERIYIAIPIHGRLKLAEECVPTVRDTSSLHDDMVALYDDSGGLGGEFPRSLMAGYVPIVIGEHIGIERQRRKHFMDFAATSPGEFTHLYLTDADAPHDPNWRSELLRIQASVGGAPVCGYNTKVHADMPSNTIFEGGEIIWRRVAPGISYLLTREHVEKVVRWLVANPQVEHWSFDWTVPSLLGNRFAVTKTSYVEHIGMGGYHHPPDAGWDGGDRALNPTPAVAKLRAEIVGRLNTDSSGAKRPL